MASMRKASAQSVSSQGSRSAGSSRSSAGSTRSSPASKATPKKPDTGTGSKKISKPSDKLNPKTVDPFSAAAKQKSAFATVYSSGGIPCRLVHGSVKHKLQWDSDLDDIPFDPVLVTLAEGLNETIHPYAFVARNGFRDLLQAHEAGEKAVPLLPKVVPSIRRALSHSDGEVFNASLEALVQLSEAVGPAIQPYLKVVLVPISKRMMNRVYKEKALEALQKVEHYAGQEALATIKSKIPTYMSVGR